MNSSSDTLPLCAVHKYLVKSSTLACRSYPKWCYNDDVTNELVRVSIAKSIAIDNIIDLP